MEKHLLNNTTMKINRLNKLFLSFCFWSIGILPGFSQVNCNSHCSECKHDSNSICLDKNQCQNKNDRFVVFDNSNSNVPYRIPAIAKNHNGDLIAVADYRYTKSDIGVVKNGKLDLHYRIKDGNSGEWGDVMTLVEAFGEGDDNIAFGDPCIVADNDNVLVLSCVGNVSFQQGNHENHQGVARFYSYDGGKTWSNYEDIGDQFLNQLDKRSDGNVNSFFVGSGKIAQSRIVKKDDYYRLYCALLVKVNNGEYVNYAFYSDDFGKNWNLLGEIEDCPIPFGADEPKMEELPNGNVVISSRISGGRAFNIFHFKDLLAGTGKWDKMAISNGMVNGVMASSNACNGEILLLPAVENATGENLYLLLQSVPMDEEGRRAKVGINYKVLHSGKDFDTPSSIAKDWDGYYIITPNTSAYSTMVTDKDNNIAFLMEENGNNSGYDMVFQTIPVEVITDGKYSYRK